MDDDLYSMPYINPKLLSAKRLARWKEANDFSLSQTQHLDQKYVILKWMTTFILCLTEIQNIFRDHRKTSKMSPLWYPIKGTCSGESLTKEGPLPSNLSNCCTHTVTFYKDDSLTFFYDFCKHSLNKIAFRCLKFAQYRYEAWKDSVDKKFFLYWTNFESIDEKEKKRKAGISF